MPGWKRSDKKDAVGAKVGPSVQCRCSFCGKNQAQVRRLIAGRGGVYICDECIELCLEILAEEKRGPAAPN